MQRANGAIIIDGKQCYTVVQAKTKKRMVELLNEKSSGTFSLHTLNNWWSFCWGNDATKQLGNIETEGVWSTDGMSFNNREYAKL